MAMADILEPSWIGIAGLEVSADRFFSNPWNWNNILYRVSISFAWIQRELNLYSAFPRRCLFWTLKSNDWTQTLLWIFWNLKMQIIQEIYTSSLKIGTPKNREFRENLAFFKTCDLLKIWNLGNFDDFPNMRSPNIL